jgi:hypothetical protein
MSVCNDALFANPVMLSKPNKSKFILNQPARSALYLVRWATVGYMENFRLAVCIIIYHIAGLRIQLHRFGYLFDNVKPRTIRFAVWAKVLLRHERHLQPLLFRIYGFSFMKPM